MKKVEITWYDAFSFDGWAGTNDTKQKLLRGYENGALCTTIAYLVEQTEGRLVVAQTLQEDDEQMGSVWVIPAKMVKEVKELVYA